MNHWRSLVQLSALSKPNCKVTYSLMVLINFDVYQHVSVPRNNNKKKAFVFSQPSHSAYTMSASLWDARITSSDNEMFPLLNPSCHIFAVVINVSSDTPYLCKN